MTVQDQDVKQLAARIGQIEDTLAIYNLFATHSATADTGSSEHVRLVWSDDAVFDLGDRGKVTVEDMERMSGSETHRAALDGGLAHFYSHPFVKVDGDTAVAIVYLQLLTPDHDGDSKTVPGHGATSGYRVHRVGANHFALIRTTSGWRIQTRVSGTLDGSTVSRKVVAKLFDHTGA